jgi:hypothetical protein
MRKPVAILLLCAAPAFAALSSTAQIDVRTGASDSNGGGFDPGVGSPGTDYSRQTSAQIAYTDLVISATTTNYTSVANAVTSAVVGNFVQIVSGTNCTTGVYEITSETGGTPNFATVDRSMGTAASVCTANLGGSFLTIGQALSVYVSGNTIWNKLGTFTVTSTLVTQNVGTTTINGYNSTHGDLAGLNCTVSAAICPTVTTATNSTVLFQMQGGNISIINEILTNTAGTTSYGIQAVNRNSNAFLSLGSVWSGFSTAMQFDNNGADYQVTGQVAVVDSEIKSSTGDGLRSNSGFNVISGSWVHGNAGIGVHDTSGSLAWALIRSTFSANSGSYGVQVGQAMADGCNFSANTGTGLYVSTEASLVNNVAYNNGAYGILLASGPVMQNSNNFYGANTTAARSGFSAGAGDGTLSASPFTSTSNFALNSTSGGGAALKAAGFPGVSPFGTGYIDVGALQSQAATGGAAPRAYVQ